MGRITEQIAEKSFKSASIQKSWMIHMNAFQPILEPAFVESYAARVHLTAALNYISRRDSKNGLKKLRILEKMCVNDADKAAWLFFMGLCFEMIGEEEQTMAYYQQAGEFQHQFYLPYLKVAKSAHNDGMFDVAEEHYWKAIHCFDEKELDHGSKVILASAYTNLASCLTMMHRYEEAEQMIVLSEKTLAKQPGREATKAIIYAALKKEEQVATALLALEEEYPSMVSEIKKMTNEILAGTHPQFTSKSETK